MSETMTTEKPAEPAKGVRMLNLNDVRLSGRVVREPRIRSTGKGKTVAHLELAVNRRYKDAKGEWRQESSFIPVTFWNAAAERCEKFAHKGSPVYVEGRLRSESWQTDDGQKRSGVKVEAARVQFLAREKAKESSDDIPFGE